MEPRHTASGTPTAHDQPKPGDVLVGRYVVEEVLGTGGMGVVVRARHRALGHCVAIKLIRGQYASDASAFARFTREARAVAGLVSDHVVRVLDFGVSPEGMPFMVMEHLSGHDLQRELTLRGPLPVVEAVDFAIQACEGLAVAHAHGVVHRDIKPANLFLAKQPNGESRLKLLDFGVSKHEAPENEQMDLTGTSVSLGSPSYMSPEQMRDARRVDLRTDLWSLGVVLYRLLTGEMPFRGNGVTAVSAAVAADTPTPPRSLRADIPAALERALLRCLEKRAGERFDSAAALALALAPFASERGRSAAEKIAAIRPSPAETSGPVLASRPAEEPTAETAAASVVDSRPRIVRRSRGALLGALAVAAAVACVAIGLRFARPAKSSVTPSAAPPPMAVDQAPAADAPKVPEPSSPEPTAAWAAGGDAGPSVAKPTRGAPRRFGATPERRGPRAPATTATAPPTQATTAAPRFGGSALDD